MQFTLLACDVLEETYWCDTCVKISLKHIYLHTISSQIWKDGKYIYIIRQKRSINNAMKKNNIQSKSLAVISITRIWHLLTGDSHA